MIHTLMQMFALIGLGLLWSWFNPGRMDSALIRKVLTDTVYFIFLPALVFNVLWQADLGLDSAKIAFSAAVGVLSALFLSWFICKRCRTHGPVTGAVLLAASFPNATYLGYPLLIHTLGDWAGPVAIQYDLFACTPILLTVGIMLAAHFGGKQAARHNPFIELLKVPPLIAAVIATSLNLLGVQPVEGITGLLAIMGSAVVPIMLFAIGLALKQGFSETRHLPTVIPVSIIQLILMPLIVLGTSILIGLDGNLRTAVVLEAAMPSMALGVVLCDRYGLNTGIYASAVTLTTLLSLITLPLWYGWL
ncbi:MAG: AEC family transporter [Gammaproteobacteria bacterium]|nr:AEC family transporter [Gammaproteobacteria bacterium]